ncbi:MAG: sulfotransferase domain-containing protein [Deltaproteobacteria bacterium]|nr:sulfotransferase domain-containing protein [Deltaproteobacteria bacterium]
MIADSTTALKYVKLSGREDLRYFPDFLIVGPQRTGTTWLHANLRYHPQIMLSEPKELYFFSSLKAPGRQRCPSNELEWYLQFFREPLRRVLLRNAISLWRYRTLYRPQVRGEATASYAAIDRDVIEEITALKPAIKVILMIRDPIERAWSHAKKDLVRNRSRKFADVTASEFEQFFADPYQRRCARYVENIDNWSACLLPGHLLVALFDDIDSRPEALLLEVMSFLGVAAERRYLGRGAGEAVNPTGASKIPERYRRFLEALLKDDLAELEARLGLSWSAAGTLVRRRDLATAERGFVLALDRR